MSSSDGDNDENLFSSLAGGQAVIDWFDFCPRFNDASRCSNRRATMTIAMARPCLLARSDTSVWKTLT